MMASTVPGKHATAHITSRRPSSIRLAMLISPSRVNSSTVPISRIYMRTGSVVRPASDSTAASAATASSSASTSAESPSVISSVSVSGASSDTEIPMSLIMRIISST